MVAALASPVIAVEMSQERDERGRWSQEDATLTVVDVAKAAAATAAAKTTEGLTRGRCWIRTSDLCDVNAAL